MIFFQRTEQDRIETRIIGEREIDFTFRFRRRRSIEIRVERTGSIIVSAPLRTSKKRIETFISEREEWLLDAIARIEENFIISLPESFENGGEIYWLGDLLKIQIKRDLKNHIEVGEKYFTIFTPHINDAKIVEETFYKWFKKEVDRIFAARLKAVLPDAEKLGIKYEGKIAARKMKSRYGTCTGDDRIFLNSNLIMVDVAMIDYVIAHELCHIREKNHSPRYYKLLTQVMPDWKHRRAELHKVVFV